AVVAPRRERHPMHAARLVAEARPLDRRPLRERVGEVVGGVGAALGVGAGELDDAAGAVGVAEEAGGGVGVGVALAAVDAVGGAAAALDEGEVLAAWRRRRRVAVLARLGGDEH